MRFAVLADIHANLTALEAVLKDIQDKGGVDDIWCLGDIVGYGPDPRQCIRLVRDRCSVCVAGNHDWAAAGTVDTADFNPDAAAAVLWTRSQLDSSETAYLAGLPLVQERDKFTLVHGSPRSPVWEYILSAYDAQLNFPYFQTPYCLVGHSHLPFFFEMEKEANINQDENAIKVCQRDLSEGSILCLGLKGAIINPGGVGQPRDNDPSASYGLYDSQSALFTFRRVRYDVSAVQARMSAAGLPSRLIERLACGW